MGCLTQVHSSWNVWRMSMFNAVTIPKYYRIGPGVCTNSRKRLIFLHVDYEQVSEYNKRKISGETHAENKTDFMSISYDFGRLTQVIEIANIWN